MTIRDISNDNVTALNAKVVRPILFGRFAFASGVRRMHTEIGPRTAVHPVHGSEVYLGVGDFGGITADVVESVSQAAQALRVSISAVNASLVSDALTDDYHRREAEFMFGFDDEDGVLIDDPVIVWSGFMDKVDISLGEGKAEMTMTCESRATILKGSSDLRFTDEELQGTYTGDLAGEYIFRMADLILEWGNKATQQNTGRSTSFASSG